MKEEMFESWRWKPENKIENLWFPSTFGSIFLKPYLWLPLRINFIFFLFFRACYSLKEHISPPRPVLHQLLQVSLHHVYPVGSTSRLRACDECFAICAQSILIFILRLSQIASFFPTALCSLFCQLHLMLRMRLRWCLVKTCSLFRSLFVVSHISAP